MNRYFKGYKVREDFEMSSTKCALFEFVTFKILFDLNTFFTSWHTVPPMGLRIFSYVSAKSNKQSKNNMKLNKVSNAEWGKKTQKIVSLPAMIIVFHFAKRFFFSFGCFLRFTTTKRGKRKRLLWQKRIINFNNNKKARSQS